jgi:RimJ/RimL family protein N-acetyltransferase
MIRIVLETERLRLREFEPADADAVREMLTDEYAGRFFQQITADPLFAERWVERNQNRYRTDGHGLWVVETRTGGEVAGDCGLTLQELGERRLLEVGYHLTAAARGRGYATEAARACLRYAFDKLDAETVYSLVDLDNVASQKVAGRVHSRREEGFERYGRPLYLYSTEREDLPPNPGLQ